MTLMVWNEDHWIIEKEELMANGDLNLKMGNAREFCVLTVDIPTSKHGFESLTSSEFQVNEEGSQGGSSSAGIGVTRVSSFQTDTIWRCIERRWSVH